MKISTWNLMRPSHRTVSRNQIFLDTLKTCDADILILTETSSLINPGSRYFSRSTRDLPISFEDFSYEKSENRVTIYSKFPFGRDFKTFDEYTSVCSEILSSQGSLIVYATIIGVTGGRDNRFRDDFDRQKEDIAKLSINNNICVSGDFNISFSGHPYPGNAVIKEADNFFENLGLDILTRNNSDSPDHIAISKSFMKNVSVDYSQISFEKKITDHSLVSVRLLF